MTYDSELFSNTTPAYFLFYLKQKHLIKRISETYSHTEFGAQKYLDRQQTPLRSASS